MSTNSAAQYSVVGEIEESLGETARSRSPQLRTIMRYSIVGEGSEGRVTESNG